MNKVCFFNQKSYKAQPFQFFSIIMKLIFYLTVITNDLIIFIVSYWLSYEAVICILSMKIEQPDGPFS